LILLNPFSIRSQKTPALFLIDKACAAPPATISNYEKVRSGCNYIRWRFREYYTSSKEYSTANRHECLLAIEAFLKSPKKVDKDPAFIEQQLKAIKSGHLLHVICAAARRNIDILVKSKNPEYLWQAMDLAGALARLPYVYLGTTLKDLEPMLEERTELLYYWKSELSHEERVKQLRNLLGPILSKMSEEAPARFETVLSACEAAQALQDYHEDFKALNLDISFGFQADGLAVSAAGKGETYRSSVHADALMHYVLLMSRTNYCGEELIIPLLRFMAEAATSELHERRRMLHDQIRNVAMDLETRGPAYSAKSKAMLDWLDTKPFGSLRFDIWT
jgi:hypothetical protein